MFLVHISGDQVQGGGGGIICLINHAAALPLTPALFTLPAMTLQFSRRCGKNVTVKDGGLVVERKILGLVIFIECPN